ncbi:MAG: glycosyltransferase family 4 protein [Enhygromyxa sp.]
MHILMTTDALGGVWSYCMELIRALQALDIRVTLACLGPPPRSHHYQTLLALGEVELEICEGRLEWMPDCEEDLARAGEWLLELERRCQPDLVHLNDYAHAALAWRAPTIVVGHSCVLSWWRAVHRAPADGSWDAYRRRVRAGLGATRAVVAPSAWMLEQLSSCYEIEFEGLVINNARRASDFRQGPASPLVLGAGRVWDPAKNLPALDAAAEQLPWSVFVAGADRDPEGRATTTRHAKLLGPLSQNELAWWMRRASIFAHPARYEPFGLAPLEAALSGCALVLGDIGSLRELWGDAAAFVDPDDHQALTAALRSLIDDPGRRSMMAARAELRARRYSVPRMAAAYHALYREVAADWRTGACAS